MRIVNKLQYDFQANSILIQSLFNHTIFNQVESHAPDNLAIFKTVSHPRAEEGVGHFDLDFQTKCQISVSLDPPDLSKGLLVG